MSEDPYLPKFKDEVAPEPAYHRRPPNRNPDGTLLTAQDGTHLAAMPHRVSPAHQAETVVSTRSNDDVRTPPSTSAEATAMLMAFDVVAVDVPNSINNDCNEPAAPSQSNHDHPEKSFSWNTAMVAVVVILIVGIVVGGVCGSGGCGGTGNGDNPSPPTRSHDIANFINSKSYMGVDLSPTGTSPEERALQWLIHDDPLQLNVGAQADEFRLLQRYSLLTLWFQGDTGTTWRKSTNWLNADECTWFGITCQSGVATIVDFDPDDEVDGNGLQGSLSPDLGLLTDLTRFDISYNKLLEVPWFNISLELTGVSGSLPSEIGLWTTLEWISVLFNNLTGSLPSEIGLWTNLIFFDVSTNHLTGSLPSEIGLWTNLEFFVVVNNNLLTGTIPATIANWKLIQSAEFQNNNFSGSMPDGICEFITGTDQLWADCDFPCSCCTRCF